MRETKYEYLEDEIFMRLIFLRDKNCEEFCKKFSGEVFLKKNFGFGEKPSHPGPFFAKLSRALGWGLIYQSCPRFYFSVNTSPKHILSDYERNIILKSENDFQLVFLAYTFLSFSVYVLICVG